MINRQNFLLTEVPQFHPASTRYVEWWREQKKYCIEGYWSSGYWMPGNLYFYVNFGTISGNKTAHSKVKMPMRPFLRDLEWEFFYNWAEARGFSGFLDDPHVTCHRYAESDVFHSLPEYDKQYFIENTPSAFTVAGKLKEYVPAREYLRRQHLVNKGRPLYENESKDFMMMGSRGFGKSYSVAVGVVLHEWLFDGVTEYIDPDKRQGELPKSTTVVGAGDSKYSGDLLGKTKFALNSLPGNLQLGSKFYPSPFSKQYSGSWGSGTEIVAKYKKKIGGEWRDMGTFSEIKHRTFQANAFAANGIRAGVMVFEEIGMFDNLLASRNASVECQMNGSYKYGSMMFLGTGGDMDGGTVDASIMFNDPESFNMIVFQDEWENTGKIGYFVPAYMGLNQYKDKNGFTLEEPAKEYLKAHREKLRQSKGGSSAIDDELQNRPIIPSEVFLTKKGNVFPTDSLRNRLVQLKRDDNFSMLEKCVNLYFDTEAPTGVNYSLDVDKKLMPLNSYPLTDQNKKNKEGAVVIYEFPLLIDGKTPNDMYVIGHDPYATDGTEGSLASVYVLKTNKYIKHGYSEIVASFVGRPYEGRRVVNETLYKLSLLYGSAKIYFENVRGNVKEYFEKIKRLDLLAKQPTTVLTTRASYEINSVVYGYPMSNSKMKSEGIGYIRDWLIEERGIDQNDRIIRNLDLLPDKGLLQELISYNHTANFDRVMGLMGCILALEETTNRYINLRQPEDDQALEFLSSNKLFNSTSNWKL